ncbi:MAG TPA: hypothetical protein VMH81_29670 [Bryobacteraceae bacterium]|nr:hypothetical protein [Bryobacteraceae bacterium]
MIRLDDLGQVAEELRKRGIDATHDFLYGPHGCVEGLDVDDNFFPLWELKLAENLEAFVRADFAAIARRRGPEWSLEGLRRARTVS